MAPAPAAKKADSISPKKSQDTSKDKPKKVKKEVAPATGGDIRNFVRQTVIQYNRAHNSSLKDHSLYAKAMGSNGLS